MNKWQRLHIAVLDAVVDDGPLTADEIVERVCTLDAHFAAPRVRAAIDTLHRAGALTAYYKRGELLAGDLIYVANTSNPKALRAVWRGESFVVPGNDGSCTIPASRNNAQSRKGR